MVETLDREPANSSGNELKTRKTHFLRNLSLFTTLIAITFLTLVVLFVKKPLFKSSISDQRDNVGNNKTKQTTSPEINLTQFDQLQKQINNEIFGFRGTKTRNGSGSISYLQPEEFGILENGQFKKVDWGSFPNDFNFWITSSISQFTKDFWYDKQNNQLFTVEAILPQLNASYEVINHYSFENNGQISSQKILYLNQAGLYNTTKIIGYLPSEKQLVLDTSGGDGCGGHETLWKLSFSGKKTIIQEAGSGCSADSANPFFIGINKSQLLFAWLRPNKNLLPPNGFSLDRITAIDPNTLHQRIISSYRSEFKNIEEVSLQNTTATDSSNLILKEENHSFLFDLATKQIVPLESK